ncbi:MAG: hypothetical protein AB1425_06520 [Actinomycetota bacterium]
MAESVMQKIEELSRRREELLAREGAHRATREDRELLARIDHDLQVLWDLRRRELAGERVDLSEDFYDRYDRYTDGDSPGR